MEEARVRVTNDADSVDLDVPTQTPTKLPTTAPTQTPPPPLTLASGENFLYSAVVDTANGYAYFG